MPSSSGGGGGGGGGGGSGGGSEPSGPPALLIELNHNQLNRTVGKTVQLSASISADAGAGVSIAWSTSDAGVANVSPTGLVTMIGIGTATITASLVGSAVAASALCDVTVANRQPLAVTVTPSPVVMGAGGDLPLVATVAYNDESSDQQVTWTSFDPAIVSTAPTGTLTAHQVGATVVRAAAVDDAAVWRDIPVFVQAPAGNRPPHSIKVDKDLGEIGQFARTIRFSNAQAVDPDGDPLTFIWEKIGTYGQLTVTSGTSAEMLVTGPGRYTLKLTARDVHGLSTSIILSDDL